MTPRTILRIVELTVVGMFAAPIQHAHAQANLGMMIVIEGVCEVTSAVTTDLNSGTNQVASTARNRGIDGSIALTCSNETPYHLALNAGRNDGGNIQSRKRGEDGQFVAYQFANTQRNATSGHTLGADTVTGSGTGLRQTHRIYGTVSAQDTPAPGAYNDVVHVTVTY